MPGAGSHIAGPGGLVGPQDYAAAGRVVGPPNGEPFRLDPDRITDRDRVLGESHVQALAELIPCEQDGAKRAAPPLSDQEGRPSRALANGYPRVTTACGPSDEGSQTVPDLLGGPSLHLGRVGRDHGRAGHVGLAPSAQNRAKDLPPCPCPVVNSKAGEGSNLAPELGRRRLEGSDIMPPTPSGNKRLDAPGQPAVRSSRPPGASTS